MSRYLIDQISKTPNIRLQSRTELRRVEDDGLVESVTLTSLEYGACHIEEGDPVFVFIGSHPRSDWLSDEVLRNTNGFVLTGRDLMADGRYARLWKERREPPRLETSVPACSRRAMWPLFAFIFLQSCITSIQMFLENRNRIRTKCVHVSVAT